MQVEGLSPTLNSSRFGTWPETQGSFTWLTFPCTSAEQLLLQMLPAKFIVIDIVFSELGKLDVRPVMRLWSTFESQHFCSQRSRCHMVAVFFQGQRRSDDKESVGHGGWCHAMLQPSFCFWLPPCVACRILLPRPRIELNPCPRH